MSQVFPPFSGAPGEVVAGFFSRLKLRYNRCLAPGGKCLAPAIRAHSIQNSRILEVIAEDGHVYMFDLKITPSAGATVSLKRVGRNNATIFSGLCAAHDSTLFSPIDNGPLVPLGPETSFLLAYRAALREHHAKLEAATMEYKGWEDAKGRGAATIAPTDPLFMGAVTSIGAAFSFHRFLVEVEGWLLEQQFNELRHDTILLANTGVSVAASTVYGDASNLATLESRLDPVFLIMNVFPDGDNTYVLFSYKARQRDAVLNLLHPLLSATGTYQRYLVSKTLLARCENLAMSPRRYDALGSETVAIMEQHFAMTIGNPDGGLDDPRLMLF